MSRSLFIAILVFLHCAMATGQELFIHHDPASTMPKGVFGVRLNNEFYKEVNQNRTWVGLEGMYGVSSKLTLMFMVSGSNHHGKLLPDYLIGTEGGFLHTHYIFKGAPYPFRIEGAHIHARYRIFSEDEEREHFRIALQGEAAYNNTAHDEAEPDLRGDNSGVSAGLTLTKLLGRFAASFTASGIIPFNHNEKQTDIVFRSGNAVEYALSCGFLVLPIRYKSYKQVNLNLYAELGGKIFGDGFVEVKGEQANMSQSPGLQGSHHIDFSPGAQLIFFSKLRLDYSRSILLKGVEYAKTYPLNFIRVQYYFIR